MESKQQAWKIIRLCLLTCVPINNRYIVQKQAQSDEEQKAFETGQMRIQSLLVKGQFRLKKDTRQQEQNHISLIKYIYIYI